MKSNASDYLELALAIYRDACAKCVANSSDLRDEFYISSRVKEEGVSFLTITLPTFATAFEKALRTGQIDPTDFRSFRKSGPIPAFLQGMTGLIFNRETGRIYDEQDHSYSTDSSVVIDSVRQICLAFKKIELECDATKIARTVEKYVTIEQTVQLFSLPIEDADEFKSVSSVLWDNVIGALCITDAIPRHGPGSTADRISGNQKFVWQSWHERLEPFFPLIDSAYSVSAIEGEELQHVQLVKPEHELPVRVVTVPKTLNGPRIIAIEPCCMQYAQQAVRRMLYATIEHSELTKGHVNFRDQSVNQRLALMASTTGQFATIDLSDASDRVPRDLALEMFRANPDLRDAIDACRSTRAKLPNGDIIPLSGKFASMGSALCFPVESMYFYTICVAALLAEYNLPVSHANVLDVTRGIYVYGDDLLVPCASATTVLNYLQKYNCKVNTSKTFFSGRFRESCGVDAYNGELVTPVYIRKARPKNRRQASELVSWVATANLLYKKGYWRAATLMFCTCESILGVLPHVSETSSGLGRISFLGYRSAERWNRNLQRFEVKAWIPSPVYCSDSIDGYPALQKCLSALSSRKRGGIRDVIPESIDELHLERFALHGAVTLQRRWVPS